MLTLEDFRAKAASVNCPDEFKCRDCGLPEPGHMLLDEVWSLIVTDDSLTQRQVDGKLRYLLCVYCCSKRLHAARGYGVRITDLKLALCNEAFFVGYAMAKGEVGLDKPET